MPLKKHSSKKPRAKHQPATVPAWFDIAVRVLLGGFFALAAGVYFRTAIGHIDNPVMQTSALGHAVDVLSILAIGSFMMLVAYLYAVRLQAISKFAGIIPTLAAIGGAFLAVGLVILPVRTDLPVDVKILSAGLVFVGNVSAIIALRYLGRSFSILPEGRKLVTNGPYRIVRHPLYVAEAVATIGAMLVFLSPAAIAIVAAQLLLQLARIHYEEKVLRETFPEYAAYARRTPRLIPGVY